MRIAKLLGHITEAGLILCNQIRQRRRHLALLGCLVTGNPRRDAIQDLVQLLRALSVCYRGLTNSLGYRMVLVQKENENGRLVAIAWRMKHTRWNGKDVARLGPNGTKRRYERPPSREYGNDLGVIVKMTRLK